MECGQQYVLSSDDLKMFRYTEICVMIFFIEFFFLLKNIIMPFILYDSLGSVEVSKESIDWVLTKEGCGNALAIMVGGANEALDAHPGSLRLKIKGRMGFVKRALIHG